jgi:hypothetical protein
MKYWHCIAIILLLLLLTLLAIGIALAQAPEVTTNDATDVTSDSATLNGNLTSLGDYSWAYVSFEWGGNTTYGTETTPGNMTTLGPFSDNINTLIPNTTYHFRAKVVGNGTATPVYGNDTIFTTAESFNLQGWGWCTDQTKVTTVTFEGYTTMVERTSASNSYSMHAVGNLTLQQPYNETITLDMYGSRVRSLFYLREEITGKSASFQGTWLDTSGNQSYIATGGVISLPNPDGQVLKTARLCFVYLRTPDVEVPLTEPGSFVQDMESMLTRFVKLVDRVVDSLIGTGFSDILSNILTKIAVLLAYLRALGTPYIT